MTVRALSVVVVGLVLGVGSGSRPCLPVPAGRVAAGPSVAIGETGYPVPAGGVFTVTGRGWGHGQGMSQHGAQGAALRGIQGTGILNFYYPGTVPALLPAGDRMRVAVTELAGTSVAVLAGPGLAIRDGAAGPVYRLPAGRTSWRVLLGGAGYRLQGLVAGRGWVGTPFGGHPTLAGPVQFTGRSNQRAVLPDGRTWVLDGTLTAVRAGLDPAGGAGRLVAVNTVPTEAYVAAVTVRESPSWWRPAALRAQAVAARTYAAYRRAGAAPTASYDLCNTTACQVYRGRAQYDRGGRLLADLPLSVRVAAASTARQIRTYGGKPIYAAFSSSNGGWTVADRWVPYLPAKPDPNDALGDNTVYRWTATLAASTLQRCFPAVGKLTSLVVVSRDGHGEWGGRLLSVRLDGIRAGVPSRVTVTGAEVRRCGVLRSTWFAVTRPA